MQPVVIWLHRIGVSSAEGHNSAKALPAPESWRHHHNRAALDHFRGHKAGEVTNQDGALLGVIVDGHRLIIGPEGLG